MKNKEIQLRLAIQSLMPISELDPGKNPTVDSHQKPVLSTSSESYCICSVFSLAGVMWTTTEYAYLGVRHIAHEIGATTHNTLFGTPSMPTILKAGLSCTLHVWLI